MKTFDEAVISKWLNRLGQKKSTVQIMNFVYNFTGSATLLSSLLLTQL